MYGPRMANFSLLDINDYFKNYNGAPRLDKYSYRPEFFKKQPESEEEMYIRRQQLMKPEKKEGGDEREKEEEEKEPTFSPEEHKKVQRMKPYIKQIIKDMKNHTATFTLQT